MIGCRMRRAVRWAMGAALLACAVHASDAVEDGVLTLDASDAGRTLQAALAARNLELAVLSSVTSLVIDCKGVVTSDVALAGWSGDLRIRPQSVFEVTADGALGTADGAHRPLFRRDADPGRLRLRRRRHEHNYGAEGGDDAPVGRPRRHALDGDL